MELATEVAIIGAGPGGYVAAIRAAQLGKKVTLIENDKLGGICLNYGCIPSKALISASEFYSKIKKSSLMGIHVEKASMNFTEMQSWKDAIVNKLNKGVEFLCKKNKIDIINGTATFESSSKLKIDDKELNFNKAIIATGSKSIEIPNFKFDGKKIIGSRQALYLDKIPGKLAVIGGGYIGLELGTVYAKLGSKVSIIEMTSQLLPGTEKDIVDIIHRNLKKLDADIYLNSTAKSYKNDRVKMLSETGDIEIKADIVLVAVGRYPNTKTLGLEKTNVQTNEKGFIKVDNFLKTTDENIYAIGDCGIGPMLAHKASFQGKYVAEVLAGHSESYKDVVVPSVIFTDPEIATVGLSENQAKEKGIQPKIGKFPFRVSSRAMTKDAIEGFVKIIADSKNIIIGVQIVGSDASDLISEAALAIKMNATLDDLALTIHPHPTLSESLMEAAEVTMGKAIHIFNPK